MSAAVLHPASPASIPQIAPLFIGSLLRRSADSAGADGGLHELRLSPDRARVRRRRPAGHRDDQRPRFPVARQSTKTSIPTGSGASHEEPRPLAVQIWDNDPETLAAVGARLADELRVSVVDINFGCPVKQVTEKAHSGSYLLRYPDRVGRIVERVVKACAPTPVTAKIRLGCTRDCDQRDRRRRRRSKRAGAAALTVHGRAAEDIFHRLGRLGNDRGDQAAFAAHSADRQRRFDSRRESRRRFRALQRRRRDDRPGPLGQPWLFRKPPPRCGASRFRPTRRSTRSAKPTASTTIWWSRDSAKRKARS